MTYIVSKIMSEDTELLPDIVDTPIWEDFDNPKRNKTTKIVGLLYQALMKRENYYQLNSPTAFGDPVHSLYRGEVKGILMAMGWEENVNNDKIIISKGKRILLIVDKVNRPRGYREAVKENNELMRDLGL